MGPEIADIVERMRRLQEDLEDEFEKQRNRLKFHLQDRRVVFEAEALRLHRALRTRLSRYVFNARPLILLTAPVIYSVAVPLLLLDLFASAYQAICFPVYGIEKVRRRDYIAIDRHKLAYLNGIEKFNCLYCGYANGLIAFAREIASRTEEYWCPIKHSRRVQGIHPRYHRFADYGDAEAFVEIREHPSVRSDEHGG